ncbi:MAG TPA: hypothetical protein PLL81_06090 [Bacillota bacterium]|nr:hypothetical protein [Bacillota bacterium]HQE01912.1 hypothetical protein [Bacillota bacterium]
METVYRYRKHLREPLKYIGLFFLLLFLFVVLYLLLAMQGRQFDAGVLEAVVFALIFFFVIIGAEILLLYYLFLRRFAIISVRLTDDAIIYDNIKGRTVVPYEEIVALKFPSIEYAGGWVQIVHSKGSIRLTVVLESIGEFVKQLKEKLEQRNMAHKYKESQLISFYKTATYSDQSWERIYENSKLLLASMVVSVLILMVLPFIKGQGGLGLPLSLLAVILLAIGFSVGEVVINRRFATGTDEMSLQAPERDKGFEKKVYTWVFGVYWVIFLAAMIIIALM